MNQFLLVMIRAYQSESVSYYYGDRLGLLLQK